MTAPSTPTTPSRLAAFRASPLFHGAVLGAFSLATAAVLTLSDALTAPAIAQRLQEDVEASLTAVLPPSLHDNDPTSTLRSLPDGDTEIPVFVAAQGRTVTGVAFEIAGNGYAGEVRLLMAVAPDGTLLGVRVLAHSETPGLGDKVEVAKSDWITQFTGLSLTNPASGDWKVKRDGGVFDQFSGATITPRAVVATVRRGLELFAGAAETLTAPLTDEEAS